MTTWVYKRELDEFDKAMRAMPEAWRYRWCESNLCGCLGAANCSGRLAARYSKERWQAWVAANPPVGDIGLSTGVVAYLPTPGITPE